MDLAHKQGQDDNGSIREKERLLLRLMMPVAKMFTAKVGIKSFFSFFSCDIKLKILFMKTKIGSI